MDQPTTPPPPPVAKSGRFYVYTGRTPDLRFGTLGIGTHQGQIFTVAIDGDAYTHPYGADWHLLEDV